MKRLLLVVLAVGLAAAAKAQEEQNKLEGKWKLKRYERAGEEKRIPKNDMASITGGKLSFPALGNNLPIKLDATKKPKQIDLMNAGTNGRQTWAGIYELEGDTLKLCVATGSEQTRPQEFTTKGADSTIMYFIFERVKK
jgi:uncharacterized protein (TIGR03067 family)